MRNNTLDITTQRIKELKGTDTQETFARKINSTQPNVCKMLNGTAPSASTLIALAERYDVSIDWLLGLSDQKQHTSNLNPDQLTYADVFAVFNRLLKNGTIITDDYHNDTDTLFVQDKILLFLLRTLQEVAEKSVEFENYWETIIRKDFAKLKILEWNAKTNTIYQENASAKMTNEEICKLANDIRNNKIEPKNLFDNMLFSDELPFT